MSLTSVSFHKRSCGTDLVGLVHEIEEAILVRRVALRRIKCPKGTHRKRYSYSADRVSMPYTISSQRHPKYYTLQSSQSPILPINQSIQLGNLVKQLYSLRRIRNPSRRTSESGLEIIGTCTQELVTNMQRLGRIDVMEKRLANSDAPALITYIDENVVAAVKSAEG